MPLHSSHQPGNCGKSVLRSYLPMLSLPMGMILIIIFSDTFFDLVNWLWTLLDVRWWVAFGIVGIVFFGLVDYIFSKAG